MFLVLYVVYNYLLICVTGFMMFFSFGDIGRFRMEPVRLGFACLLYLCSQEGGLVLDCSKLDRDGRKMEEYSIGCLS